VQQQHTKPSGVVSVEASPPGLSLESMIIHDGPSCALRERRRYLVDEIGTVLADEDVWLLPDQWDPRQ